MIQKQVAAAKFISAIMNSDAAVALNDALKVGMDDPRDVASAVLQAIQNNRSELYLGWPEKLFVRLNGMLPGLVDRALRYDVKGRKLIAALEGTADEKEKP